MDSVFWKLRAEGVGSEKKSAELFLKQEEEEEAKL